MHRYAPPHTSIIQENYKALTFEISSQSSSSVHESFVSGFSDLTYASL